MRGAFFVQGDEALRLSGLPARGISISLRLILHGLKTAALPRAIARAPVCRRSRTMMSLPFLIFACALGAAWLGRRGMAIGFWVAGLVVMLVLFRIHATEVLSISL